MGVPAIFFSISHISVAARYTSNELLIATLIPAISSAFVPTAMVSVTSRSTVSTELAVDVARSADED